MHDSRDNLPPPHVLAALRRPRRPQMRAATALTDETRAARFRQFSRENQHLLVEMPRGDGAPPAEVLEILRWSRAEQRFYLQGMRQSAGRFLGHYTADEVTFLL